MNPLSANLVTGTVGELIVQLRLLHLEVQSVPTHKDTGNDLLATRDEAFRAVQVPFARRIAEHSIRYSEAGLKR